MRFYSLLLSLLILVSCTSSENPINQERKELAEKLERIDVRLYRGLKLGARGAVDNGLGDVLPASMTKADLIYANKIVLVDSLDFSKLWQLATVDKDFVLNTNEDDYPTIYGRSHGNQALKLANAELPVVWTASHEHLMLALITIAGKRNVNGMSLYEASLIDEHSFSEDDWAIITHLLKGVQYCMFEWPYLAELEFTKGLDHLDHASIELELLRGKDQQAWLESYEALFLVFRAIDRMKMEDNAKFDEGSQDLMNASHLLEKNDNQQLLVSLIDAQNYLSRDEDQEALLALSIARNIADNDEELVDEILTVSVELREGDKDKAADDLQELIGSRQVIMHAFGNLFDSLGLTDELAKTNVGKQYFNLKSKTDRLNEFIDGIDSASEILDKGLSLFGKKDSIPV